MVPKSGRLTPEAKALLSEMKAEGNLVHRHPRLLDRKQYEVVNAALTLLGGKWNRQKEGHVFPSDATAIFAEALGTGVLPPDPKDHGYFPTSPALAREAVARLGELPHGARVLEPSAGQGALIAALLERHPSASVTAIELLPKNVAVLRAKFEGRPNVTIKQGDFLELTATTKPGAFDAVIMNPPFEKSADVHHVTRALHLSPRGPVVAIASAGVQFRDDKAHQALRKRIEARGGTVEALPEGSFKEEGTGVRTVIIAVPASGEPASSRAPSSRKTSSSSALARVEAGVAEWRRLHAARQYREADAAWHALPVETRGVMKAEFSAAETARVRSGPAAQKAWLAAIPVVTGAPAAPSARKPAGAPAQPEWKAALALELDAKGLRPMLPEDLSSIGVDDTVYELDRDGRSVIARRVVAPRPARGEFHYLWDRSVAISGVVQPDDLRWFVKMSAPASARPPAQAAGSTSRIAGTTTNASSAAAPPSSRPRSSNASFSPAAPPSSRPRSSAAPAAPAAPPPPSSVPNPNDRPSILVSLREMNAYDVASDVTIEDVAAHMGVTERAVARHVQALAETGDIRVRLSARGSADDWGTRLRLGRARGSIFTLPTAPASLRRAPPASVPVARGVTVTDSRRGRSLARKAAHALRRQRAEEHREGAPTRRAPPPASAKAGPVSSWRTRTAATPAPRSAPRAPAPRPASARAPSARPVASVPKPRMADTLRFFAMKGKELADLAKRGDAGAAAEIERRKAKR